MARNFAVEVGSLGGIRTPGVHFGAPLVLWRRDGDVLVLKQPPGTVYRGRQSRAGYTEARFLVWRLSRPRPAGTRAARYDEEEQDWTAYDAEEVTSFALSHPEREP